MPENVVLLARLGTEPAGYVFAEIVRRPETPLRYAHAMVYLHHISVAAPWRKRGVGRALAEAVRRRGAQQGIRTLALDVWSFNEPARRFFFRCGLTPYNERLWIERCWFTELVAPPVAQRVAQRRVQAMVVFTC